MIAADTVCMAQLIHDEARGEGERGMEAVAQVILNRIKDGRFGKGACGVARAPRQFSGYHRSLKYGSVAYSVAARALVGDMINRVGRRLYFNTVGPSSALRIGRHKFW